MFFLGAALAIVGSAMPEDGVLRVEQPKIDFSKTTGGLQPIPGIKITVLHRASTDPSVAHGWTYHHHPDLACWKGRTYAAWSSNQKDEDTGPSRELYRTSKDGKNWGTLQELFPVGVSTPLRMYFYHAKNGVMLAVAGLRTDPNKTSERNKNNMVVRRIANDHTLGPVHTLRPSKVGPPLYTASKDPAFVTACDLLLSDRLFLEQQDYGNMLPADERMKWHDQKAWKGDDNFGKAMCFFRRKGGEWVAVGKKGWVTVSKDGKGWSVPVQPETLVTGGGKVWVQKGNTGRYIIVFNPDRDRRWPLMLQTSQDGVRFGDPRVIHGPLPEKRYEGEHKDVGASYVRGISLWANDGSRPNDPIWLIFSVNKEDIWLASLPQP